MDGARATVSQAILATSSSVTATSTAFSGLGSPAKSAVPADEHCRDLGRRAARHRRHDGMAGSRLVVPLHLFGAQRSSDRDLQMGQVGMSGTHYGDGLVSLRPGRGPRRMGVDHAPDARETFVEDQMGRGVGRGAKFPLDHLAVRAHHHHVVRLHGRIWDAGWLDDDEPAYRGPAPRRCPT